MKIGRRIRLNSSKEGGGVHQHSIMERRRLGWRGKPSRGTKGVVSQKGSIGGMKGNEGNYLPSLQREKRWSPITLDEARRKSRRGKKVDFKDRKIRSSACCKDGRG